MGSVYKAHDPVLDRMVAVKVMAEDAAAGPEGRERFLREAQSAARLNHPNIITVFELGEDAGQFFIVMELLEGDPLSRLIGQSASLPLRRKLGLMVQICEGLAFAHQRGVVHRDIKPANIFVLSQGQVKILDFGIARVGTSELTRTGLLMGTPHYMSPEQARGRRTDQRSDIFSVGIVFYELLAGRKPFAGDDFFEVLEKVRSEDPPPLGEVVPELPPALVRAVHRTLSKDPASRYQSLDELRADLAAALELLPTETTPESLREAVDRRFAEVARLHRILASAVGAAALGDETLPLADPSASGEGMETVLRDLERRTDRLRALVRTVESLEPAVTRGIAAFERGAFEEAAAALQPVLAEIPQHQRARDYFDRARIELARERTVRSFAPGRMGTIAARAAPAPEPAAAGTAVATPLPTPAPVVRTPPPARPAATDVTRVGGDRRVALVLGAVALLAAAAGGVLLFRPLATAPPPVTAPSPPAPVPRPSPPPAAMSRPPATTPPAPAPAARPPASTAAPRSGSAPAPAPAPAPARPPAAPKATAAPAAPAPLSPEQMKAVEDAVTLAQLFQARGDHERALREFRRALAIDPRHAEARAGASEAEAGLREKK
jgi:serine/threonine-protein kinase